MVDTLGFLQVTDACAKLAEVLLAQLAIPAAESRDATHVAISAVHRIDYLLTWNCRHLANANLRPKIDCVCKALGYEPPIICTPAELRKVKP